MKTKKIMAAILLVVAFTVSATFAWAGSTIKFVNESKKDVQVKVQTMMPPATWTKDQSFTLNANSTKDVVAEWPCVKAIWVDNVQKLFPADDKSCLSLSVINLVVTIKKDGKVEYNQQ